MKKNHNNEGKECSFTAVDAGEATITVHSANDESIMASCVITVNPVVLEISEAESILVQLGKTLNLSVTVTPHDVMDKSVTWTSSNPSIASVDESGVVTAVNWGETTITATSKEDQRINVSCKIIIDPFNGHEYVDLGLKDNQGRSIYWATCNVGAIAPEDCGYYFAWGATTGYAKNTGHNFAYVPYYETDANNNLTPKYDAATQNWGGAWRMPTWSELRELANYCNWTWTTLNGVKGYKVSNKNDSQKYIFLPVTGYRYNGFTSSDNNGYYWSSTSSSSSWADVIYFMWSKVYTNSTQHKSDGLPVRPICVISK